ncbi:MAG: hypothetical protein AAGB34_05745 [Planctomycetota bacterium]
MDTAARVKRKGTVLIVVGVALSVLGILLNGLILWIIGLWTSGFLSGLGMAVFAAVIAGPITLLGSLATMSSHAVQKAKLPSRSVPYQSRRGASTGYLVCGVLDTPFLFIGFFVFFLNGLLHGLEEFASGLSWLLAACSWLCIQAGVIELTTASMFRLGDAGHCSRCGYSLAGLASDAVCPECGRSRVAITE